MTNQRYFCHQNETLYKAREPPERMSGPKVLVSQSVMEPLIRSCYLLLVCTVGYSHHAPIRVYIDAPYRLFGTSKVHRTRAYLQLARYPLLHPSLIERKARRGGCVDESNTALYGPPR